MITGLQKDIKYWVDIANYDLKTADAMLKSKRYIYVIFTCQQALEKLLKGIIIHKTKQFPPKSHDLNRLAELAKIDLFSDDKELLDKLNFYYIETRYPEEVARLNKNINQNVAKEYLTKTKKLFKCLNETLK